jgi:hypothetical protein
VHKDSRSGFGGRSTPSTVTFLIASVYMAIGSTREGISRLRRMHLGLQHNAYSRRMDVRARAPPVHIHMHALQHTFT